ncbi:hypothetical protein [Hoeflea sp. IMCC20628]|uniref:hypothetical protein n=1 Tax=Hoeflea sp. IMCC20628 TaxID=1620421 RepID=UPI0012E06B97|nr:hypothetical protein [Hoeflea sp. IMCC20628]
MANQLILSEDGDGEGSSGFSFRVKREKIGDFVKSLLGQPYEIERPIKGQFDLNKEGVNHLIQLIEQRIAQQNEFDLIEFNAKIGYADGHIRTISNIETFSSYVDTSNSETVSIKFIITYLIFFPGKEIPEKQEIDFKAFSSHNFLSRSYKPGVFITGSNYDTYGIVYLIRSTERTWAEDIDNMLKASLDDFIIDEKTPYKLISIVRSIFVSIFLASSVGVPVIVDYYRTKAQIDNIITPIFNKNDGIEKFYSSTIEVLRRYLEVGPSAFQILYYIIFFASMIFFSIWVGNSGSKKKSYVVLNKKAEKSMKEFRFEQSKEPFRLVRDVFIGLIVSSVANYAFYFVTKI